MVNHGFVCTIVYDCGGGGGCKGVMHDCCVVTVVVAPCGCGDIGKWCDDITKLVWPRRGCGDVALTVVSRRQ